MYRGRLFCWRQGRGLVSGIATPKETKMSPQFNALSNVRCLPSWAERPGHPTWYATAQCSVILLLEARRQTDVSFAFSTNIPYILQALGPRPRYISN